MPTDLHIISLGAGVQSSTMALMAAHGELTPMPHCGIFADTQVEPGSVYRWLDWLEKQLPFPVYRVTQGNLEEDAIRPRERQDKQGYWVPCGVPAYTINPDGTHGQMPRQCTGDFKIAPIAREVRRILKDTGAAKVTQWIGISLDEVGRMKPARVKYVTNIWPLIDARMTRHDCMLWMKHHGYPSPPRSACRGCPYKSNAEWRRLRDSEPAEFQKAIQFERQFQQAKSSTGFSPQVFLHADRVPLDQVDLSTDEDRGQLSLFNNECEGLCGV